MVRRDDVVLSTPVPHPLDCTMTRTACARCDLVFPGNAPARKPLTPVFAVRGPSCCLQLSMRIYGSSVKPLFCQKFVPYVSLPVYGRLPSSAGHWRDTGTWRAT